MTAEKVDGRAVLAVESVETPLSKPDQPVLYTRIVRLLLDDDSEVLGCTECDHTADALGKVRAHLVREHGSRRPWGSNRPKDTADTYYREWTIGELIDVAESASATADALERMTEDRNEWKARARKAEAAMATLKKVLS